jgi:glycosyltransferase involved in cell wall biosynthesis
VRIAYIHARPQGHPIHEAYAVSLNPDKRLFIDFILRWHDVQRNPIVRYTSWMLCALFFPQKRKYNFFYADGVVHFLAIMRVLKLLSKQQKVVYLMDDETLYFIKHQYYSSIANSTLRWILRKADGFVCVGEQQKELLHEILKGKEIAYRTITNGIADARYQALGNIQSKVLSKNIICIANVADSNTRVRYKGLDYIPQIANEIKSMGLKIIVIGEISQRIQDILNEKLNSKNCEMVFAGKVNDIDRYLSDAFMAIHPSRGESWGISVLECMRAGVPTLVSKDTGSKEVVVGMGDVWVQPAEKFASLVDEYYNLSEETKKQTSAKARRMVEGRTFTKSVNDFSKAFSDLANELARE